MFTSVSTIDLPRKLFRANSQPKATPNGRLLTTAKMETRRLRPTACQSSLDNETIELKSIGLLAPQLVYVSRPVNYALTKCQAGAKRKLLGLIPARRRIPRREKLLPLRAGL